MFKVSSFWRTLLVVLCALCACPMLTACGGDDVDDDGAGGAGGIGGGDDGTVPPTTAFVATGAAENVTFGSADIVCAVNTDKLQGGEAKMGVNYSTSADFSTDVKEATTNELSGSYFKVRLTGLSPQTTYYYRAFLVVGGIKHLGGTKSFTTSKFEVTAGEAVDLGLSVKWASCNVGASKPEEAGLYFAWGETQPKGYYSSSNSLTVDRNTGELRSAGIIDSKGNLTANYDAATMNLGKGWRMPTNAEISELVNKCNWTWQKVNGINGYVVKGSNGNSVFLPAAGYRNEGELYNFGTDGYYWSSTVYDRGYGNDTYYLYFRFSNFYLSSNYHRDYGQPVRPVSE